MKSSQRPHQCAMLRERAYDYRRGELPELERALFEQALKECPACALYVARLGQLLAIAKDSSADTWLNQELDQEEQSAMFASILTSLGMPADPQYPTEPPSKQSPLTPLHASARLDEDRLAATTALAHQADVADWPNLADLELRADALFDKISAQLPQDRLNARIEHAASAAKSARAEAWMGLDTDLDQRADALFDKISAQLDLPKQDNVVQLNFPQLAQAANDDLDQDQDDDALTGHARTSWGKLIGFAAAIALCAGAFALHKKSQDNLAPSPEPQLATQQTPTPKPQESAQPEQLSLAALSLASSPAPEAIKVLASQGAAWTIKQEPKSKRYLLNLERGTVLVEFVPTGGESLRVHAQGTEVQVVGTVFYVSSPEETKQRHARVGVLKGKVRVKRADDTQHATASTVELISGQELQETQLEPTPIHDQTLDQGAQLIDLEHHDQRLAAASATANNPPQPPEHAQLKAPERVAPQEPKQESVDELRTHAQQALRERQYSDAAALYERALARAKGSDTAFIRLELSNLYTTHLKQPSRAIPHLKQFVARYPNDIAAPTARKKLCALLATKAHDEPLCNQ